MVDMKQHPDTLQQATSEALKDLVEEIRHEYPNAAALTLREFDGSLDLCRLKEAGGYAYGLDDCDSLFEAARSVDLSDPSWTSGVAESVVSGGRYAWLDYQPSRCGRGPQACLSIMRPHRRALPQKRSLTAWAHSPWPRCVPSTRPPWPPFRETRDP